MDFPSNRGGDTICKLDDRVYFDPRTGGFVVQMLWVAGERTSRDTTDVNAPWESIIAFPLVCETYVGNNLGHVPLKDVLNEWMELGATHGTLGQLPLSFNKVFIDDRVALDAMLI